ncbi:tRNA pseudouridine(38-40) synthase TruA [Ferruginibacter sp. SUN106]|uniref:tRNA pseudouridine(38-40) synthase TruA n=1 Tax=Ferruginibacter sp. SUN106 TaxID=2978348 RepID=UPI003D3679EB
MPRYFIEVSYKGTNYSGFQIQQNANSIQAEIEKALKIYYKEDYKLTGSSRTDAGVHAMQNFFHFDSDIEIGDGSYHLNAILPADVVIKRIFLVESQSHCRFDAFSREYTYHIYRQKDPFLQDRAYFYPHKLDIALLQQAARELMQHQDFATFSKRNTQVKTTLCTILTSEWKQEGALLTYQVSGNRFLRGMVRGMVGTMLQVGKKKTSISQFINIIKSKDCTKADFAVPPQGLFLQKVNFPSF